MQRLHRSGELETIPFPEDLLGKYQEFTEAGLNNLRQAGYTGEFISLEEGVEQYFQLLSANDGRYI